MPRNAVNYHDQPLSEINNNNKVSETFLKFVPLRNVASVGNFQWIVGAQLSMACFLQGITLCWTYSPLNWRASLNFLFLIKSLWILHLHKMARNAELCLPLSLHVIPLQSLKIFLFHLVFIHLAMLCIQLDYSAADSEMRTVPPPSHAAPFLFSFISLRVTVRWWYAVMSPARCCFH